MESVRMICSVKEFLFLSQCNIGNAFPQFSLCLALLVRDKGRHRGGFFFLFCFVFLVFFLVSSWKTFTAEECPHPPLKRQVSPQAPDPSRDCYMFL